MALFNPDLLDKSLLRQISSRFVLRPLEETDYQKGILATLAHLTTVGNITKGGFQERFHYYKRNNDTYFVIVVEDLHLKKIAGCGTMFLERKFIHQMGSVGHLEDVVTLPEYRGMQFGRLIILALTGISHRMGAYKTILDCIDSNIPFYKEKCGFSVKETQMTVRHPENDVRKSSDSMSIVAKL